ncbi:MAG: Glycosyl transferase, WecB/TagA/CpsF family [Candidatus Peregrinibacteria bacterium GW2011_GWA2_44_7]|nr:MAG: Glycosyl transferase, WecB/TagA/CpsF family [Candidatus Peregrinibacteria bacterium GW2011_GWA2_44_7]
MRPQTAIRLRQEVKEVYDSIAEGFHQSRSRGWADFEFFDDYYRGKDEVVLDVGCGNGRLLRYLEQKKFKSYLGIDNCDPLLRHAKKEFAAHEAVGFKKGNILEIPVEPHHYSAVFTIAVLHHIPSRALQLQALKELGRVMTPEGKLYLSVWNLYRWRYATAFIHGFFRWITSGGDFSYSDLYIPWGRREKKYRYCHAFRMPELLTLLKEAGFEVLDTSTSKGNLVVVARPFLPSRRVSILGVEVDGVTLDEAEGLVKGFLQSNEQHYVVTPNPEIVLHAQKSKAYREILNRASLKIPDGVGLLWASRWLQSPRKGQISRLVHFFRGVGGLLSLLIRPHTFRAPLPERVTGVDLMERLTHHSYQMGAKIFLLGAAPGVAEQVREKWRFDQIVGTYAGAPAVKEEEEIVKRVNDSEANILFVAYGAPKQEEWMNRNLKKMPGIKVAMGVGGAFDFVAGVRQRAPQWMNRMGLEWLWRVGQEPSRLP